MIVYPFISLLFFKYWGHHKLCKLLTQFPCCLYASLARITINWDVKREILNTGKRPATMLQVIYLFLYLLYFMPCPNSHLPYTDHCLHCLVFTPIQLCYKKNISKWKSIIYWKLSKSTFKAAFELQYKDHNNCRMQRLLFNQRIQPMLRIFHYSFFLSHPSWLD